VAGLMEGVDDLLPDLALVVVGLQQ